MSPDTERTGPRQETGPANQPSGDSITRLGDVEMDAGLCRPGLGARPGSSSQEHNDTSVSAGSDTWAKTYRAARLWIIWSGRKRWPDFVANDEAWALSVASWWLGPGAGGRDG